MTETTFNLHAEVNEYKNLSAIMGDVFTFRGADIPDGYTLLKSEKGKDNFKAAVFKKGCRIFICYQGTDIKNFYDNATNIKMATSSQPTSQMDQALDFYKKCEAIYGKDNITVVGHSEGGSEALYVGILNHVRTITFNAFGLESHLQNRIIERGNKNCNMQKDPSEYIYNYRDPYDPVSKIRKLPGNTFIVNGEKHILGSVNPFGMVEAHRIQNFGDCKKAVPLEEYKKNHKHFIDDIDEVEITDKDIEKMPNELYAVYDNEISKRLSKNKILKSQHAEHSALMGELIKVTSYTRDDGTHVDSYYRRLPNTAN
ncbi:MAG: Mbeg1-like protein [Candidatus Gastranaerophilaceae bacterium]